jgi:uncharacterized integral membrane protein
MALCWCCAHVPGTEPFKRFNSSHQRCLADRVKGYTKNMNSRPAVPPQPASGPAGVATTPTTRSAVTRLAAAWWALVVGLVILIILLIFVAQNTGSITAHFLGLDWSLPVGVGYLLAAAAGATTTVLVGAARMIQLRRVAKEEPRAALSDHGAVPPRSTQL